MINIKIKGKEGFKLDTKHKYCDENIKIELDSESYEKLNPENIAEGVEILGVTGSHQSGIKIVTTGLAQGSPVPNDGTSVSTIYFNENLSYSDIKKIIDEANLPWINLNDVDVYPILFDSNTYYAYAIDEKYNIFIWNFATNTFVDNIFLNGLWTDYAIENDYKLTFSPAIATISDLGGIPVGTANELLSSLVAVTEFEEVISNVVKLEGTYDGNDLETSESVIDLKGLIGNKKIPLNIKFVGAAGGGTHKFLTLEGVAVDGGFEIPIIDSDVFDNNFEEWNYDYFIGKLSWQLTGLPLMFTQNYHASASAIEGDYYIAPYFFFDISEFASVLGLYNHLLVIVPVGKDKKQNVRFCGSNTLTFGLADWVEYPSEVISQFVAMTEYFKIELLAKLEE